MMSEVEEEVVEVELTNRSHFEFASTFLTLSQLRLPFNFNSLDGVRDTKIHILLS